MKHVYAAGRSMVAAVISVSLASASADAAVQAPPSRAIYQDPARGRLLDCPDGTRRLECPALPQARRAPCPDGSYQRRCPPPRDDRDDHDGIDPAAAVVGVAVAGILIGTLFGGSNSGGRNSPEAKTLLRDGPQMPMTYPVGTFSVRGFARNGWPVVLDFRPEPYTLTTLDVIFPKRTVSLTVDTNGLEGRHLVKLGLPAEGPAKKAVPATYVLRSVYRDGTDRAGQPAPVDIYGIGGGPRAVGSVAIEQLSMLPGTVTAGTNARFAFSAKSPFNRTRAEVLKFMAADNQRIQLERVMSTEDDNVSVGPHGGVWDGRDQQSRAASLGLHRFQVRAWFTSDDRSWVGAIAPNLVRVSQ
ncbi:hypothetical protein GON01_02060 [Sphingomonas sp. MAH-20]|uniref:Uncharacterized protein n=1 Tax=Sphingomonas horti TaxID=2682842 RepID=A0A6I4IXD5_9SPHN|nr:MULTISPECIES: hypothetical protein [Sphingomonas]MBA2920473.1 hypothetical protein [Sphingomonas sp. CGMCC 1.13658]MVO76726.1 hypothetical protein [Sphingomonas horti]